MPASGSSPNEVQENAGAAPVIAIIEERNPRLSNIAASRGCPGDSIATRRRPSDFPGSGCGTRRNRIPYGIAITALFGGIRMQFHGKKLAFTLGLCALSTCVLAQQVAEPAGQKTKQSLFKAQHFDQAAISPDGKHVAWVEIRGDEDGAPTGKQDIYVQEITASGKPMRVTAGVPTAHFNEGNVAWSPDSKQICFISDAVKSR